MKRGLLSHELVLKHTNIVLNVLNSDSRLVMSEHGELLKEMVGAYDLFPELEEVIARDAMSELLVSRMEVEFHTMEERAYILSTASLISPANVIWPRRLLRECSGVLEKGAVIKLYDTLFSLGASEADLAFSAWKASIGCPSSAYELLGRLSFSLSPAVSLSCFYVGQIGINALGIAAEELSSEDILALGMNLINARGRTRKTLSRVSSTAGSEAFNALVVRGRMHIAV